MRIVYCNKYNFAFSGTEVYLFELMELMRSHGHEVALFSMTDPRGEPTRYDQHFVPAVDFKNPEVWASGQCLAGAAVHLLTPGTPKNAGHDQRLPSRRCPCA